MVLILLFAVLFYTVTLLVADVVIVVVVVAFNFSFEFDAPRKKGDEERVISFDIVVTDKKSMHANNSFFFLV